MVLYNEWGNRDVNIIGILNRKVKIISLLIYQKD